MAYDERFRRCVIEYKNAGHTFKEVYKVFGVDSRRYYCWRRQLAETGSLTYRASAERKRKIDKEELLRLVEEHPDWYLREFAESLDVCFQAVQQMFRKPGVTRKKTIYVHRKVGGKTGRIAEAD
ncbi:hypothetical protein Holit_00329 [Hollandina sp. SP2]